MLFSDASPLYRNKTGLTRGILRLLEGCDLQTCKRLWGPSEGCAVRRFVTAQGDVAREYYPEGLG